MHDAGESRRSQKRMELKALAVHGNITDLPDRGVLNPVQRAGIGEL
jgi:hypothetical protein